MPPPGVVSSTVAVGDESSPHGAGVLLYRSPPAVGDEESGSVFRGRPSDRSVLIENLESVQLDDVFVFMADVRVEFSQGDVLEVPDRSRWISVDADCIPSLENLGAEVQDGPRLRTQSYRIAARTERAFERDVRRHLPLS